jgi:hypothetical protein
MVRLRLQNGCGISISLQWLGTPWHSKRSRQWMKMAPWQRLLTSVSLKDSSHSQIEEAVLVKGCTANMRITMLSSPSLVAFHVRHVHRRTVGSPGPLSSLQGVWALQLHAYFGALEHSRLDWFAAECSGNILGWSEESSNAPPAVN